MTINEKERVIIYKRIINENENKESVIFNIKDLSDEKLLELLNSTVLANAISPEVLKYSLMSNLIMAKGKAGIKKVLSDIERIKNLSDSLSRSEKDLMKFGLFYGFKIYNWKFQMNKFVTISSDITVGELNVRKKISSYSFQRIFPFINSIIKRGEKNGRFPRF